MIIQYSLIKYLDRVQAGPNDCHNSVSFAVNELRSNSMLSDVMSGVITLLASSGLRVTKNTRILERYQYTVVERGVQDGQQAVTPLLSSKGTG